MAFEGATSTTRSWRKPSRREIEEKNYSNEDIHWTLSEGNCNLLKHSGNNEVLKALCARAASWFIEED
ncbi:hypothetical protein SESBI_22924 [Sesbania bispinosa]|nr:hypothetical protein SESBI_22924 [Sesbania bispinosa]